MYTIIHVLSTIAHANEKGNPPNRDLDKQTYIARDTGCPALRTGTCTAIRNTCISC